MVRQFLIPWLLLAEFIQVNCQPPPQHGFEHVDHFQHLFTHPSLPQQHPFGIGDFRALHNQPPIIHPHYELLAQHGHMMGPNFIHQHPFFHLHPNHFTSNSLVPQTTSKLSTPTPTQTATAGPSTTTEQITTTIASTTQESTTTTVAPKIEPTRAPQALKPVVESVKTYALGNAPDQKQETGVLSSLGEMEIPSELKRTQHFPTPSSTVLPTAQQIENQTTTVETTPSTTILTTISSTTVTTQPTIPSTSAQPITTTQSTTIQPTTTDATTNLPKKISDIAERATENGEKLDLIKHLNTNDLESFLKSANLSTNEAQKFLRLVEKVLEEELQKRLHKQVEERFVEQNRPLANSNLSASIRPVEASDKLVNGEGHEVKTVNTRLSYESSEIDQTTNSNTTNSTTQSSVRVAAYSQRSALEINSAGKSKANPTFSSLDEVRQREQEEFDRLLGKIVLKGDSDESGSQNEEQVDQNEDDDLLGSITTPPLPVQSPPRNNYNRPSVRHPPQTTFDRLVQDYQYRLSGNNGFNDLIKALRNAHIGFFDRTKRNRKIKIN